MTRLSSSIMLVCASGCASMMAGGPDHVPIATNPPGARVFVDDVYAGTTPGIVTLDREHSSGRIVVAAPGYYPALIVLDKHVNGWFWGNIVSFGWLGMLIDVGNG